MKRTPLFSAHQKLGGRLIEFGGWEMPVQYTGIIDEHNAVRTAAGIFDIAHMGEFFVTGPSAAVFLNGILTNNIHKLSPDQAQYTLMCNERGGVIDDLYVYRLSQESFLIIANASRIEADFAWLERQLASFRDAPGVKLSNASDQYGAVAIQGPKVKDFIDVAFPTGVATSQGALLPTELKKNEIGSVAFSIGGSDYGGFIARTGYTGEDGFEVVATAGILEFVWNKFLNIGAPYGMKPAGLGARDTLRTEVCYPLYGHELDENTTPIEAGVGFFVALDKGEFIGRSVLAEQKASGVSKRCVGFKMTEKSAPPRPHYPIWSAGAGARQIGDVTSGTQSPSLGAGIGMGYVPPEFAKPGTMIEIEIRGRRAPAMVVQKPIYKKQVPS